MLKIEKTVLPSPEQWEIIIEGMRNPMNSWDKRDSAYEWIEDPSPINLNDFSMKFVIGVNDHDLMMKLANGGSTHAKYRRMIPVFVTINAPLYWWKEFDTYKVGTTSNSCSTMHKIHAEPFSWDNFSHEHLFIDDKTLEFMRVNEVEPSWSSIDILSSVIVTLNEYRKKFLETNDKKYWWQMIQLLPNSYNQKRTVMLNYEVLFGMYRDRRNHKLDEWHTFCDWIKTLPYSEIITGETV